LARVRELDLPPSAKLILYALASRADDRGRCWPSIGQICRDTGLKRRAVQVHLRRLIDLELVARKAALGRANTLTLRLFDRCADGESSSSDPRMSCAPGAHDVRTPAHHMRGTCARGAPEVTKEVTNNHQHRTDATGIENSHRSNRRIRPAWWLSEDGAVAKGQQLGLPAQPGESFADYKARLFRAIEESRTTADR
jgi:hypothetical protein